MISENSDLYEFRMALFDNGDPDEFLLFIRNFNMTPEETGTIGYCAKVQYLCTQVRGEVLHQFDALSNEVEGATPTTLENIILGLGTYFFPVNALSKKNCVMRRIIRKPRGLKVRRYMARLIDLNEYLAVFPGGNMSENNWTTELYKNLLNSTPRSWIK